MSCTILILGEKQMLLGMDRMDEELHERLVKGLGQMFPDWRIAILGISFSVSDLTGKLIDPGIDLEQVKSIIEQGEGLHL